MARISKLRKHWLSLRRISAIVCSKTIWLLLSRPHLIPGTVLATLESIWEAETEFGNSHGANNLANAYKHAAWNALIAYHTQLFFRKPTGALSWAKKITDLHEECFINHPAAKAMDIKNNEIGREIYLEMVSEKKINKKALLRQIRLDQRLIFLD